MALSAAERQRRHRRREADGVQVVAVEIEQPLAEGLVASGYLSGDEMGDREKLAAAIKAAAMSRVTRGVSRGR